MTFDTKSRKKKPSTDRMNGFAPPTYGMNGMNGMIDCLSGLWPRFSDYDWLVIAITNLIPPR
jgi:hypothetical protein